MKKINLLLVLLTLTSCNLNSSKGYEFAHSALDSLLNEVTYDESIEVKNALYHEYDEDSNLNEVVVMYFTYEHSEYGLMDEYLKYEYDEDKVEYLLTLGEDLIDDFLLDLSKIEFRKPCMICNLSFPEGISFFVSCNNSEYFIINNNATTIGTIPDYFVSEENINYLLDKYYYQII